VDKPTILALLTCHNRRDTTLACLRALEDAAKSVADLEVVLVDAGSSDGTREAVSAAFPYVRLVEATPDVYWTSGMRLAWSSGSGVPHTHVLWLNDDLRLDRHALKALLAEYEALAEEHQRVILAGRVVDPASNRTICGGHRRRIPVSCISWDTPQAGGERCDTFGGNCVLLPRTAFQEIGNLSSAYRHSLGDMDYGLRAKRAGYAIFQSRVVVGHQEENPQVYSVGSMPLTVGNLKFALTNPKGLPPGEVFHFCRSHGGLLWPADFVFRYLRAFDVLPSPFPPHGR
jgi:GT2 family glycosyltransferase